MRSSRPVPFARLASTRITPACGAIDQIPAFFRVAGRQHLGALRRQRGVNHVQTRGVPHDGYDGWFWLHFTLSAGATVTLGGG